MKLRMRRVLSVLALILGSLLALTACYTPYHNERSNNGISWDVAKQAIEAVDGIAVSDYYAEPYYSDGEGGLFSKYAVAAKLVISIEDGYKITEPEELLNNLLEIVWNINTGYRSSLSPIITVEGGVDQNYDWYSVVTHSNLNKGVDNYSTGPYTFMSKNNKKVFEYRPSLSFMEQQYDSWASQTPDILLGNYIARGQPDKQTTIPAIYAGSTPTGWSTSGREHCYVNTVLLNANYELDVWYQGEISYEISYDNKIVETGVYEYRKVVDDDLLVPPSETYGSNYKNRRAISPYQGRIKYISITTCFNEPKDLNKFGITAHAEASEGFSEAIVAVSR